MTSLDVAAGLAVLVGAAVQAAVGFGFGLVCAPLIFAAYGPVPAVGLVYALSLLVNLLTLLGERRRPRPDPRTVVVVLACAVPGMVAGVAILRSVDERVLQALLSVAVLVTLAVQRRTPAVRRVPPAAAPVAGLVAGVLTTTTTTAGPPLVLLLRRDADPQRVRDTLVTCFLGLTVLGTVALAATGTTRAAPDPGHLAALAPLAVAGQLLGRRAFARLAAGRFQAALTGVLLLSVAVGLLAVLV